MQLERKSELPFEIDDERRVTEGRVGEGGGAEDATTC